MVWFVMRKAMLEGTMNQRPSSTIGIARKQPASDLGSILMRNRGGNTGGGLEEEAGFSGRRPEPLKVERAKPQSGGLDEGDGRHAACSKRARDVFPVNIAIADKNPLVLAGLNALFEKDGRFNVVTTASDGEGFLNSVGRVAFDLGVIGWEMPLLDARHILAMLGKRPAAPKIVVYSGTSDSAAAADTLRLGGAGFVSKREPPERLLEVLASVAEGDMVFPFVDVRRVRPDPFDGLTNRERDLLAALGSGQTNAELAKEFGVSVNTIKFHLRNLFEKLNLRNRAQAISLYLETKR
jgi:two-component system, NarL family, nitrate/nitrite response regulator NarP